MLVEPTNALEGYLIKNGLDDCECGSTGDGSLTYDNS
jgi:hypothetical protein